MRDAMTRENSQILTGIDAFARSCESGHRARLSVPQCDTQYF